MHTNFNEYIRLFIIYRAISVWNALSGGSNDDYSDSNVSDDDKYRVECDKLVSGLNFALTTDAKAISDAYIQWCYQVSQEYVGASCCHECPVIGSNYVIDVPSMTPPPTVGEQYNPGINSSQSRQAFSDDFKAIALAWLFRNDRIVEVKLCESKAGLVIFRANAQGRRVDKSSAKAVLTLIESSCSLENQIRQFERDIARTVPEVRAAQRSGNAPLSRRLLHKVGALKAALEKRTATAENVNALLFSISNAATDAQVLDVCRDGARVLRNMTIGESGERLTPEAAEAIMDDVLETIYDQQDVNDEILRRCSGGSGYDEDDEDIEDELRKMESEIAAATQRGGKARAARHPARYAHENEEEEDEEEEYEEGEIDEFDRELEELDRSMNDLSLSKAI